MRIPLAADRFEELVLYIAKKCEGDADFGATKLNKILWFADCLAFRSRLKSISGATYQKLEHGPAPKCLVPVQNRLVKAKELAIQEVNRYSKKQKRPVALREPNLADFDPAEIAIVDDVIDALAGARAVDVSELSHDFAWQIAELGEEIPIEVSLVEIPKELTASEIAHAQKLEPDAARLAGVA